MSEPKFGTDGIRGVANSELTPELALRLGLAAGRWLADSDEPKRVAVGTDTRVSGGMLESALAAGLTSAGIDVVHLGVAPTPAVAFVTRRHGFGLGAVISASHNPAPDNGIKLFGSNGAKLSDATEKAVEAGLRHAGGERPIGSGIGRIVVDPNVLNAYLEHLSLIIDSGGAEGALEKLTNAHPVSEGLKGMKVAVDCAHGAAYQLAPRLLHLLDADVVETGTDPDGMNINAEGGATKPETICRFTVEQGADVGVAFDGDADRVIFCDSEGALVNGDRAMGIWAAYHMGRGELNPPTVVGTVMSNGGFEHYLNGLGITLLRTPVGDKYVSRELEASRSLIGGEQSGHIIFPKHAPSGDGLLSMLEVLRVVKLSGKSMSDWSKDYKPWPQILINLTVAKPKEWDAHPAVRAAVEAAAVKLEGKGRVNVRPSGTQPMLRVMVEADSYELRDSAADQILQAMQTELGATVYGKVDLTHDLGD